MAATEKEMVFVNTANHSMDQGTEIRNSVVYL